VVEAVPGEMEQRERRIIQYFLRVYDPELLELYEADDFDFPPNRILFQIIKNYGTRYGNTPTFEVVTQQLQEVRRLRSFHELEASYIAELLSEAFSASPWRDDEVEFWKDYAFDFLRARRIEKALRQAASSIREDRFEQVVEVVRQLAKLEKGGVEFEDWREVKKRKSFAEDLWSARKIPTPFRSLNLLLRGGLCPGQLGVIVAPPKIGKSFLLVLLGDEAARRGFNVLHLTLEMSADEVLFRYDTRASGGRYTLDEIQRGKFDPEVILQGISQRKGKVVVSDVSTRRCTLATIEMLYDKAVEREGVKFDLILLDYMNLVHAETKFDNMYKIMDVVSAGLHSFAKEKNAAIWTIARTNRLALEGTVRKQHIGESYAIMYNCDVLLSAEALPSSLAKELELKRRESMASKMGLGPGSTEEDNSMDLWIGNEDDDEAPQGKRKLLMRCLFIRNAPHFGKVMAFEMDYKHVDFKPIHCFLTDKLKPEELKEILDNEQVVLC